MLGAALTSGVTPVEAREIVYQAVPYVGMGKAFDFIHATNDTLTERGIELPLAGQSATEIGAEAMRSVLARVKRRDRSARHILVPPRLIPRAPTAAP